MSRPPAPRPGAVPWRPGWPLALLLTLGPALAAAQPVPAPPMAALPTTSTSTSTPTSSSSPGLAAQEPAPPPPFEVTLEPRELKIGQQAVLRIAFRHSGELTLRLPEGASFGKLELIDKQHDFERDGEGRLLGEVFRFTLAGFEAGEVELPGLPFFYVDAQGREDRLEVPGTKVRIRSLLENDPDQELAAARPPLPVVVEDLTLLYLAGVLGALLLGLLIGLLVYRAWRRRPQVAPVVPLPPPERVARERLAALERSDLLARGLFKEFYLELSGILREYLERRFGIDATAQTSSELVEALYDRRGRPHQPPLDPPAGLSRGELVRAWATLQRLRREELESFFDEADLVQFALYQPSAQELVGIFAAARSLVERTTPLQLTEPVAPVAPMAGSGTPPTAPATGAPEGPEDPR